MKRLPLYIILILLAACTGKPTDFLSGSQVSIYPDYTEITVPSNIAPLNFIIKDTADKYLTVLEAGGTAVMTGGRKVVIPIRKWRRLTGQGNITVTVFERKGKEWIRMKPFGIYVSDEVDPYITYRIIPPTFESYQKISIAQRDITCFSEKTVYSNSMTASGTDMHCINCHSFRNWHTDNMQFHVRQMMGGTILYRAFSYQFAKSFPVLSKGFEIETEMSIHAIDKNMQIENVVIEYRDRPEGSESKLNTYSDGFKVLKTILRLFRNYKPMAFFGSFAIILLLIAAAFFVPILSEYLETGLVPRYPTLFVCGFVALAAIQSFFSGMILSSIVQKNRQDFEYQLQQIEFERKRLEREEQQSEKK